MTWTTEQFDGFCHLLAEWWKDELTDGGRVAWELAISDIEPMVAVATLKQLLRRGNTWRPSVAEFVAALSTPAVTFDEAWGVIQLEMRRFRPGEESTRLAILDRVRDQAGECAAGWLAAYGVDRLALEPVNDPDYGGAVVKRLRDHYAEVTAEPAGRDRLARALDDAPRRGELKRFDPALALPERVS